jgi:secondary thiamine-phosphate synthase enzyme
VTDVVVDSLPELQQIRVGMLHLFLQHTSASLTINENADPDVPLDLADGLARLAPDDAPCRHTCEGPDDMPAHIKTTLTGSALMIPVSAGYLALGTWQGIYLCEHRRRGGRRRLVATLWGEVTGLGRPS